MARRPIDDVLNDVTARLTSIPGVIGTAEGRRAGRACVTVFVVKKTPALLRRIPATFAGYPVAVEETGQLRALDR
jgi:hypothetical protein